MAAAKPTPSTKTPPPATDAPKPAKSPRLMQKVGRFIARTSVPEILLVTTLCFSRYIPNSDFSYPSEPIITVVLFSVIVTGVFYLYRLILRSTLGAHIAALLLAYGLYGYTYTFPTLHRYIGKLIPDSLTPFSTAMLQVLCLGVVFGLVGYGANRLFKLKRLQSVPALKFVVFVMCFIFVAQMGKVGLRMWEIRKSLTYTQPTSSLQKYAGKATGNKPNVYYLLFDRYANATTLANEYKYDNTPLLNALEAQGFVTRQDAYANYPFTMQSVSSTLAAGYHTKVGAEFKDDAKGFQAAFPYRQFLDNSPVTQAFKSSGYQYNQVSSWWDFTRINPSADTNPSKSFRLRMLGKNFWLTDLQRDIVNKSILSPLLLKGITVGDTTIVQYQLDRNPTQNFYAEMSALKTIAANASTQAKPQFTFAHVLSPHDPYIFDAEGNKPTYDSNRTDNGVDETVKYTNQVTFLNTQITELVNHIRKNDPGAVIVMQADEGPYPKQFRGELTSKSYYDPYNLPVAQQRQKFGILAAYYLPNADKQAVSENIDASVNAFRYVLNRYVGYTLPQLPDCQYTVGDKFNLYTYHLVTGQLKGTTSPAACLPLK